MILVRDVLQAKYGKGGDLVALFKEARKWPQKYAQRILTDASGQFFTIVVETEAESLADWEKRFNAILALPQFRDWFTSTMTLVDTGRREFYNIE
jgi:hypothetical protein